MKTGKVEYAPDYKSKSQVKRIAAQKGVCSTCGENHAEATKRDAAKRAVEAERARLRDAVMEAAKKWRHRKSEASEGQLFNVVCDLEKFEIDHKER